MTLDQTTIARLAEHLEQAELNRAPVTKITDDYPAMDWDDAYAIQYAIRARKQARGTRVAGLKMGLTSHAKMKQMGVNQPAYGFICDYGACADGSDVDRTRFIHPRVEAEIAIVTKTELKGPGCHAGTVLAAIDFVVPALEIIDSRFKDFKFDLKSVIADNTSSAGFVVGGRARAADEIDMRTIGVVLEKNGRVVELGAGAAVVGHPATSVAMLANMLAARGESIPAGTFVMTGGITAAVMVDKGDAITVRYQDLGTLGVRFI